MGVVIANACEVEVPRESPRHLVPHVSVVTRASRSVYRFSWPWAQAGQCLLCHIIVAASCVAIRTQQADSETHWYPEWAGEREAQLSRYEEDPTYLPHFLSRSDSSCCRMGCCSECHFVLVVVCVRDVLLDGMTASLVNDCPYLAHLQSLSGSWWGHSLWPCCRSCPSLTCPWKSRPFWTGSMSLWVPLSLLYYTCKVHIHLTLIINVLCNVWKTLAWLLSFFNHELPQHGEVEITCRHQSFSIHFITLTIHKNTCNYEARPTRHLCFGSTHTHMYMYVYMCVI